MSVPEGTMKLVTTRQDIWFCVSAMNYLVAGRTPPEGFKEVLKNIVLPHLNAYLEVTDGPAPVSFPPRSEEEASVG